MAEDTDHKVLTKTAYEHLVVAVGKMLEEGKKAGQQADSSLAKIYWTIGREGDVVNKSINVTGA